MNKIVENTDSKKIEARRLREAYDALKKTPDELTQLKIARLFGYTQGLVQAWFAGKTRVPDATMFQLCNLLKVDPLEIRPELRVYLVAAKSILSTGGDAEHAEHLLMLWDRMDESQREQLESYGRFLIEGKKT